MGDKKVIGSEQYRQNTICLREKMFDLMIIIHYLRIVYVGINADFNELQLFVYMRLLFKNSRNITSKWNPWENSIV